MSDTPSGLNDACLDFSDKTAIRSVWFRHFLADLFQDGKQIFTDYISLYRFNDGWKLVGKTFQRH